MEPKQKRPATPTNHPATVSLYQDGKEIETFDIAEGQAWEPLFKAFGDRHPDFTERLHMIEIFYPDETDPAKQYFRFGTDPSRMKKPAVAIIEVGKENAREARRRRRRRQRHPDWPA